MKKRNIFLGNKDYFRFVHDLFELNDEDRVSNITYQFKTQSNNQFSQSLEVEPPYFRIRRKPRKLLVEILIFALMPNHFHLLLRQKKEDGIVRFMQKLGTGYTMYFNQKYNRVGGLFQGRFKAVLVNEESHFIYLPYYIHLNPLELNFGGSTSKDWEEAMRFLGNYRWSSFLDYIGEKNFPSVTSREFLLKIFGGEKNHKKGIEGWLKEKEKNFSAINDIVLEKDVKRIN